jgi:hypothetical protein
MVTSAATSVTQYLEALEPERRRALATVRARVKRALPKGYVEVMQYGMINYVVSLARFPNTYNGQPLSVLALASQKQHMAVYFMGLYGDPKLRAWFERAYAASGKRLDMGRSCLRFKRLDDLALDVVADAAGKVSVDAMIAQHEAAHGSRSAARKAPKTRPKAR